MTRPTRRLSVVVLTAVGSAVAFTGIPPAASGATASDTDLPVIVRPEHDDTATRSRPAFSGTGPPGAEVTVAISCEDSGGLAGRAQVDPHGAWTFVPEEGLPSGECAVIASAAIDGTVSAETAPVSFTVDAGDDDAPSGAGHADDDLGDGDGLSVSQIVLFAGVALLAVGVALYAGVRRRAR